ncbi:hypothetical protein A3A03_03310 [Candidatus Nomurabacteria bacterium RIFCSPLOWO2_01_FULL_40_18]|uniref:Uncharacterized protein n=1 Tax=Candidatus Nomurabacteria bacterium RIFCSPLOWO2_01_FULL_40_18 TaxID=1801773 RepID=A0A1F6XJJ5_9BACT|nr:MAG: hypothetical protein A3A03_03310 [Candidatus Nomurabacteria bacterium RIFCSPLOWO2_01_FULL_40_18]
MKFRSDLIKNILNNQESCIENVIRPISHFERVVIAQGYGASSQVPRRFLAYAVPVLRLASQMSEMTTVEFYFATRGVQRANGIYYDESLSKMRKELSWLVNIYYPRLNNRVRILEDAPLSSSSQKVIDALFHPAKKVMEKCAQIHQFAANRGGDSALRYMLEHLLYMRDPIMVDGQPNKELLVPEMTTDYKHLIMVGGPAEKIFWHFRQEMLKECGSHSLWKSYQFFTSVGDPPTYHPHEGEPLMDGIYFNHNLFKWLEKLPSEFGKQKNLIRDYSVLLQEFAKVQVFKLPHEVSPDILHVGEEILHRYSYLYKK